MRQKYAPLMAEADDNGDGASRKSRLSSRASREKVESWLNKEPVSGAPPAVGESHIPPQPPQDSVQQSVSPKSDPFVQLKVPVLQVQPKPDDVLAINKGPPKSTSTPQVSLNPTSTTAVVPFTCASLSVLPVQVVSEQVLRNCLDHRLEKFGICRQQITRHLYVHSEEVNTQVVEEKLPPITVPMKKVCSYCSSSSHEVANYVQFKSLNFDSRWKAMRQKGLCRSCLIPPPEVAVSHDKNLAHQNHHPSQSYSLFRYLPVVIQGNGKQISTYAFLIPDQLTRSGLAGQATSLVRRRNPIAFL